MLVSVVLCSVSEVYKHVELLKRDSFKGRIGNEITVEGCYVGIYRIVIAVATEHWEDSYSQQVDMQRDPYRVNVSAVYDHLFVVLREEHRVV